MNRARLYLGVCNSAEDRTHQDAIGEATRKAGFVIARTYRQQASDDRYSELLRLVSDLRRGDVVVVENIDCIRCLPLPIVEKLILSIREKNALLAVHDVIDLSDLVGAHQGVAKIVLEAVQDRILSPLP